MLLTRTSFLSIIAIGGIRELCFEEIRGGAGRLHSNVADGVSLFIFVPYISKKCFFSLVLFIFEDQGLAN